MLSDTIGVFCGAADTSGETSDGGTVTAGYCSGTTGAVCSTFFACATASRYNRRIVLEEQVAPETAVIPKIECFSAASSVPVSNQYVSICRRFIVSSRLFLC